MPVAARSPRPSASKCRLQGCPASCLARSRIAGQLATACSDLADFIGDAQSQSGKGLTVSQANQLIAAAKKIQAVLGC